MIINARVWKKELLRSADRLEKKSTQRRWTDQSAVMVEKDIMIGGYTIRKLMEAPGRLTDQTKQLRLPVISHRLIASMPPDWWTALDWSSLYDMDDPIEQNIDLRSFCNLIIHSFIFAFQGYLDDDGLAGVFVTSEYESEKSLLFIATVTLVEVFRAVGNDEVNVLTSVEMLKGDGS